MIRDRRGQQEMVGFVLIVVVVMVAMMIFLVISVRDSAEGESESLSVSNMISAMSRVTSECAITYEPDYDSVEELFKDCYRGKSCGNLNVSVCDYLNESFGEMMEELMGSEGAVDGWRTEFFAKNANDYIMVWSGGNCSSFSEGAQKTFIADESLVVRMRIC